LYCEWSDTFLSSGDNDRPFIPQNCITKRKFAKLLEIDTTEHLQKYFESSSTGLPTGFWRKGISFAAE
jgi:hypothetical protein